MGMHVSVYRAVDFPDCTNGGISSKVANLCVINVPGPFEPDAKHPAVRLVKGPYNSIRLVPEDLLDKNAWVMYGGNSASTSDSRFCQAVEEICGYRHEFVKIFDRVE